MALRVSGFEAVTDEVIREHAKSRRSNVRAGRCFNPSCRVGVVRPNGGPTYPFCCPRCGERDVGQSTWASREIRRGVIVISLAEAQALARGDRITLFEPVKRQQGARGDEWPENLGTFELHDAILSEPDVERLRTLNAELAARLG